MTTYDKKRVGGALLLVFIVLAAANWHFNFVFPSFAGAIAGFSGFMVVVWLIGGYFPTQEEFQEHRRRKGGGGRQ